jgi:hypothetical protein
MELSISRSRDHNWKIPAINGPICWEHVIREDGKMRSSRFSGEKVIGLIWEQVSERGDARCHAAGCGSWISRAR